MARRDAEAREARLHGIDAGWCERKGKREERDPEELNHGLERTAW
jgi:hypothetical protein